VYLPISSAFLFLFILKTKYPSRKELNLNHLKNTIATDAIDTPKGHHPCPEQHEVNIFRSLEAQSEHLQPRVGLHLLEEGNGLDGAV
jgi:hypothetical protein